MMRPNYQQNQFQPGSNYDRNSAGFRSPMPLPGSRYQSPPRFHQPYFSGPGGTPPPFPSPRGCGMRNGHSPAGSPRRGGPFSSPPMYGMYNQQQMCSPGPPRFRSQLNTSMGSPSPFFNNSMNRTSGSGTPDSYKSSPSTGSERSTGRGGRINYMSSPFRGDGGDIRQYVSMNMLADPWENLRPSPVTDTSSEGVR